MRDTEILNNRRSLPDLKAAVGGSLEGVDAINKIGRLTEMDPVSLAILTRQFNAAHLRELHLLDVIAVKHEAID